MDRWRQWSNPEPGHPCRLGKEPLQIRWGSRRGGQAGDRRASGRYVLERKMINRFPRLCVTLDVLTSTLVWNLVVHIQTFAYLQTARNSGLVLWKMPSELVWKILSATESLMPMVMLMPVCRVVFGGDSVWKSH